MSKNDCEIFIFYNGDKEILTPNLSFKELQNLYSIKGKSFMIHFKLTEKNIA